MTKFIKVKNGYGEEMVLNLEHVISMLKMSTGRTKVYYDRTNFVDELETKYDDIIAMIDCEEVKEA